MRKTSLTASFVKKLWETPFTDVSLLQARYGIVDYIASSYTGKDDPGASKLKRIIAMEGGHPLSPLLYRKLDATPVQAAMLNGYMGHALDYDDVHMQVRGHPSTVILPALLALCEPGTTGRRLLEAYILGVEAMARLAQALTNDHYEKGFHNTGTTGVLAAALAGAYLRGFAEEQACLALGFAASQAGGLRVHFGTETKPLHAGLAAAGAVRSIQLAAEGFQASDSALDGGTGFFAAYGHADEEAISEQLLGSKESALRIVRPGLWFKLHPFCSAAYYGVHALEKLSSEHIESEEIASVELTFTHRTDAALIHRRPSTGEEGRFSLEYIAALSLSGLGLKPDYFQPIPIQNHISLLMSKMNRSYVTDIPGHVRYTKITVTLVDGRVFSAIGDHPKGSPGNPVTEKELEEKFRALTGGTAASQSLLQSILELDGMRDVSPLLARLRDFEG